MERFHRIITSITTVLTALLGLLGTIASLWDRVRQAMPFIRDIPAPQVALASVVLLVVAVLIAWRSRFFASTVPFGIARSLDIGNSYLEGRAEDVDRLLSYLSESPMNWLVGESGAGKSSVLKRGVVPELSKSRSLLGIYLESWGADWVEGPRRALTHALLRALDDAHLDVPRPLLLQPDETLALLGRIFEETGRLPVLIFDQFDDYQTRHGEVFLEARSKTVLSSDELMARNTFWREIRDLLIPGRIHCVFVTRSDSIWGLESVRFCQPKIYRLGRIEQSFATTLLRSLTSDPEKGVLEPGFEKLQGRLIRDLGPDGWVLPIQMRVAFRGLAGLPHLTVSAYEAQGGLSGLEALHIRLSITEAARKTGWDVTGALQFLVAMTDRPTGKTIARSEDELSALFAGTAGTHRPLETLLRELESADIIRQRVDQGHRQPVWLLDHDYLTRGVLELDRRAHRWPLLLEESHQAFVAAQGPRKKWAALLRPVDQVRLAWERLHKRLRYGPARNFARLSLLRILLNVWMFLGILGLTLLYLASADREARRLFSVFGIENTLSDKEKEALWDLADASTRIRAGVIEEALALPSNARRFNRRHTEILHALVGLDPKRRKTLLQGAVRPRCLHLPAESPSEIVQACASMVLALDTPSEEGFRVIIRALQTISTNQMAEGREADLLIEGLAVWLKNTGKDFRQRAVDLSLDSMANATQARQKALFGKMALVVLAGDPNPAARHRCRRLALASFSPQIPPDILKNLSIVLKETNVLSPQDARTMMAVIAQTVEEDSFGYHDIFLKGAVEAIRAYVPAEVGKDSSLALLASMKTLARKLAQAKESGLAFDQASIQFRLVRLANLLGELGPRVPPEIAREAVSLLSASMSWEDEDLLPLVSGLGALNAHLPPDTAEEAIGRLLNAIDRRGDYRSRSYLTALKPFIPHLKPAEATRVSDRLLRSIQENTDYFVQDELLAVVVTLGDRLTPEAKEKSFRFALTTVERTTGISTSRMVGSLQQLYAGLGESQSQQAYTDILKILDKPALSQLQILTLIPLLESAAPKLSPELAWRAYERILDALDRETERFLDGHDTATLVALGARLPSSRMDEALARLERHFRETGGTDCRLAAALIRPETLPRIIELMKWPTCGAPNQAFLLERLGEMSGKDFGLRTKDGRFIPDVWGFVDWAKKAGLSLESPKRYNFDGRHKENPS